MALRKFIKHRFRGSAEGWLVMVVLITSGILYMMNQVGWSNTAASYRVSAHKAGSLYVSEAAKKAIYQQAQDITKGTKSMTLSSLYAPLGIAVQNDNIIAVTMSGNNVLTLHQNEAAKIEIPKYSDSLALRVSFLNGVGTQDGSRGIVDLVRYSTAGDLVLNKRLTPAAVTASSNSIDSAFLADGVSGTSSQWIPTITDLFPAATIDLGQVTTTSRFAFSRDRNGVATDRQVTSYTLSGSSDGATWYPITQNNSFGSLTAGRIEDIAYQPATYRYFKFSFQPSTAAIDELEIFQHDAIVQSSYASSASAPIAGGCLGPRCRAYLTSAVGDIAYDTNFKREITIPFTPDKNMNTLTLVSVSGDMDYKVEVLRSGGVATTLPISGYSISIAGQDDIGVSAITSDGSIDTGFGRAIKSNQDIRK